MLEKLKIIYSYVEDAGGGSYIIGQDGRYGLMQNGKITVPVEYQHMRLLEQFVVAGVSDGFGYAAVFDMAARRLLPAPSSAQKLVEVHSVNTWDGVGLVMQIKESPTYKNPMQLVFLGNSGVVKSFEGVTRLPLAVDDGEYYAVVGPGAAMKAPGFAISCAQCRDAVQSGQVAVVLNRQLDDCTALFRQTSIESGAHT